MASTPTALPDFAALLAELNLSHSGELTLDAASRLVLESRAALLSHLRGEGMAAGHAGKVASALSRAIRQGRTAHSTSSPTPSGHCLVS